MEKICRLLLYFLPPKKSLSFFLYYLPFLMPLNQWVFSLYTRFLFIHSFISFFLFFLFFYDFPSTAVDVTIRECFGQPCSTVLSERNGFIFLLAFSRNAAAIDWHPEKEKETALAEWWLPARPVSIALSLLNRRKYRGRRNDVGVYIIRIQQQTTLYCKS